MISGEVWVCVALHTVQGGADPSHLETASEGPGLSKVRRGLPAPQLQGAVPWEIPSPDHPDCCPDPSGSCVAKGEIGLPPRLDWLTDPQMALKKCFKCMISFTCVRKNNQHITPSISQILTLGTKSGKKRRL